MIYGWMQALADFMLEQQQEAQDHARADAASSMSPPSSGWHTILGLKGSQTRSNAKLAGSGGELGELARGGLQCCDVGDGVSLALYFTGGSQVAVLNFRQTASNLHIIDTALLSGGIAGGGGGGGCRGSGGGLDDAKSRRSMGKIVGLHVLDAEHDSGTSLCGVGCGVKGEKGVCRVQGVRCSRV